MGDILSEEQAERGRKGGKKAKKPYRFGTIDIARAAMKSVSAVQKARQRGRFDPYDLSSLVVYIIEARRPGSL